jgi:hypothetical protein
MIGAHLTVSGTTSCLCHCFELLFQENLASHRAEVLSERLPMALAYGLAEMEPDEEPLKVSILLTIGIARSSFG